MDTFNVRELVKPVYHHVYGIPQQIQDKLRKLRYLPMDDPKAGVLLAEAVPLYEKLAKQCDAYEHMVAYKCPEEKLEHAVEIFAHLVIDLAFVHDAVAATGYPVGEFPYNDLADKLFARKEPDAYDC